MCGIAGFLSPPGRYSAESLRAQAEAACRMLAHRGPDDSGTWIEPERGLAFAVRRLAVIDPSSDGAQPMPSADGRYVLSLNGEIYNHGDLREELADGGVAFRGRSDTEVLLAAIAAWGLEAALERANGMFAFALWDRRLRALRLGRDRLGQKPLYYGWLGATFAFASELKALIHHPEFEGAIDRDAFALYMRYGRVPAPRSIYRGVRKLPPATLLSLRPEERARDTELPPPRRYWSLAEAARKGAKAPFEGGPEDAADALDDLLREAVRRCMVSDVPLGAFLSGGMDSSTVVALMQAQSGRPAKTFSIGFREAEFDEAAHARAVARHLGTDHHELVLTPEDAQAVVPDLPRIYDEPFADVSQIPTALVSRLARRQVTVALTGDGGDELFGGYNRHLWGRRVRTLAGAMPPALRRAAATGLRRVPADARLRTAAWLRPLLPPAWRHRQLDDKWDKLASAIAAPDALALYRGLVSLSPGPSALLVGGEPKASLPAAEEALPDAGLAERIMLLDGLDYLPNDILVKLDRAAMAVGLEGRAPYLDHRVVEFAWRLPLAMKLRGGRGKWLLRRVLHRYVPARLVERPKAGFAVPLADWLRGDLRQWAEDLLDARRLGDDGLLDPAAVQRLWSEHLDRRGNHQHQLWAILMWQAWRRERTPAGPMEARG